MCLKESKGASSVCVYGQVKLCVLERERGRVLCVCVCVCVCMYGQVKLMFRERKAVTCSPSAKAVPTVRAAPRCSVCVSVCVCVCVCARLSAQRQDVLCVQTRARGLHTGNARFQSPAQGQEKTKSMCAIYSFSRRVYRTDPHFH